MQPTLSRQMPLLLRGVVSKAKAMMKTVTVVVPRPAVEKRTRKEIIAWTKYLVHDEKEISNVEDIVRIASCRRLSSLKTFTLDAIEDKAKRVTEARASQRPGLSLRGWKLGPVTKGEVLRQVREKKAAEARERRAMKGKAAAESGEGEQPRTAAVDVPPPSPPPQSEIPPAA